MFASVIGALALRNGSILSRNWLEIMRSRGGQRGNPSVTIRYIDGRGLLFGSVCILLKFYSIAALRTWAVIDFY